MQVKCWFAFGFIKIKLFFAVACVTLCLDSLRCSQLQSYSDAIVATVTYYKQHIFREKAVIVQKCGTNGFVTLLYAFLQCNPYAGPWKLSPIEVRLSSSIKAMFAIELWCYTFPCLYPPPSMSCFIWVHNHNGLSNGSKMLFSLNKITVFYGSCGENFETHTAQTDYCYY